MNTTVTGTPPLVMGATPAARAAAEKLGVSGCLENRIGEALATGKVRPLGGFRTVRLKTPTGFVVAWLKHDLSPISGREGVRVVRVEAAGR